MTNTAAYIVYIHTYSIQHCVPAEIRSFPFPDKNLLGCQLFCHSQEALCFSMNTRIPLNGLGEDRDVICWHLHLSQSKEALYLLIKYMAS